VLLPEPVGPVMPMTLRLAAVGEEVTEGRRVLRGCRFDEGEDAGEGAAVAVQEALAEV